MKRVNLDTFLDHKHLDPVLCIPFDPLYCRFVQMSVNQNRIHLAYRRDVRPENFSDSNILFSIIFSFELLEDSLLDDNESVVHVEVSFHVQDWPYVCPVLKNSNSNLLRNISTLVLVNEKHLNETTLKQKEEGQKKRHFNLTTKENLEQLDVWHV